MVDPDCCHLKQYKSYLSVCSPQLHAHNGDLVRAGKSDVTSKQVRLWWTQITHGCHLKQYKSYLSVCSIDKALYVLPVRFQVIFRKYYTNDFAGLDRMYSYLISKKRCKRHHNSYSMC